MGQQQGKQRVDTSLSQPMKNRVDSKEAVSFLRHQQRENREALKRQMGPVILTPWYEFEPGSCLPPKKKYKQRIFFRKRGMWGRAYG